MNGVCADAILILPDPDDIFGGKGEPIISYFVPLSYRSVDLI